LIKQLTSGDDINVRKMRQDGVEFTPQCKLLIAGNNRPQLSTTNVAMRRRFRVTDFPVVIPEEKRDKKLKAALEEAQGGSTGNFAMDDRRLSGMAEERA